MRQGTGNQKEADWFPVSPTKLCGVIKALIIKTLTIKI